MLIENGRAGERFYRVPSANYAPASLACSQSLSTGGRALLLYLNEADIAVR